MKATFRSTHTPTTEAMFRSMYTDYCGGNVHLLWRKCLYTITMETTFSVGKSETLLITTHLNFNQDDGLVWTSFLQLGFVPFISTVEVMIV